MATICEGWSVLEIGTGAVATSMAAMMLADNGARVLKVEPPTGDRLRSERPSGFLVWNRGKESLIADLGTDDGRALVREAALHADVLLAGVPPGRLEQWGLDYDTLRDLNPSLVHCSVTGFGPTGAYSSLKAYEGVVAAKVGMFARGPFGFRPGPIFYDALWASSAAAHEALAGVLAALLVRERTGRGQRVEATLANGVTVLDYYNTMHWQYARAMGDEPQISISQASGVMAATRTQMWHATKDSRFITTTAMQPKECRAIARAAGVEHILDDPRFANAPKFVDAETAQDYENVMWEAFRTRTLAEWLPILRAEGDIAFEVAVTSEEGLEHPQMVHNGEVITVEDPVRGPVRMIGPVARFDETPSVIERLAPELGANGGPLTGPAVVRAGEAAPAHALAGVTIVECGYFFAMPFGPTLVASLGARVIKIEGQSGDPFRDSFGAPETTSVRVMEGKESLSIDLQSTAGRGIMHRLLATADVFVTSFRPGVPERLGLDPATLRGLNPNLVYVHATGYGTSGPYSSRAMYATSAMAAVGIVNRHAGIWLDPEVTVDWGVMEIEALIKPRLSVPTDGDSNGALSVLNAIMLGLTAQRRTGHGQHLSLSMLGGNALNCSDDFCSYAGKPSLPLADEDNYGLHALYRLYEVADGWIFLAATTEREWTSLVDALDAPALAGDGRFATAEARGSNDAALIAAIAGLVRTYPAAQLEATLTSAGIGCAAVCLTGNSAFTSTDPVMRETGMTVEVDHPLFGRIVRHAPPVVFSETPGRVGPSALRGDHTDAVLAQLGYGADDIAALKAANVVFGPDPLPERTG